jgi:hypothetical protein
MIHRDIEGVQICEGDEVVVAYNPSRFANPTLKRHKIKSLTELSVTFVGGGRTESPTRRIIILKGEFIPKTKCKCSKTT